MTSPRDDILAKALELGFDTVGIAAPDAITAATPRLDHFLEKGYQGDMQWMAEKATWRRNPQALWPDARSIIMLGMNYGPDEDPLEILQNPDCGGISVYARGRDYHDVVKKRLKQLARWIVQEFKGEVKVFVDTAPVMEKPLGQAAGVGWQGKHTNLVSRQFGSWLFLGSVFTTLELDTSQDESDHCGGCKRCLNACPTGAFPAPYQLDARRCISYLTIELKGQVSREFRTAIGNRIYGCDDCLAVCPWNKFASKSAELALTAREDLKAPPLIDLLALDDTAFRKFFSGSPVKRIGRNRFIRNCLIAAGNSGDPTLTTAILTHLDDPAPQIRGMAVWALSQLMTRKDFDKLKDRRLPLEADGDVSDEWRLAAN